MPSFGSGVILGVDLARQEREQTVVFESTAGGVNVWYERWREAAQVLLPDAPAFDQEYVAEFVQQAQQRLADDMSNALYGNYANAIQQQAAQANHFQNLGNQISQYGPQVTQAAQRQPLPALRCGLRTVPHQHSYTWPRHDPNYRLVQAYVRYGGVDYALHIISPEMFYQLGGAVVGHPAYVSLRDSELLLYPGPEAEYDVSLILQDSGTPRVYLDQDREFWTQRDTVTLQWGGSCVHDTAAEEKALQLLKEWLTPVQLKDFEQHQYFFVRGSKTRARYKITRGATFNVVELDAKGDGKTKLCFRPVGASTIGDTMLAQKIMLETDEPRALKIANRSSIGGSAGASLYNEPAEITRRAFRRNV